MPENEILRSLELSVSALQPEEHRFRLELHVDGKYVESSVVHLNASELRHLETDLQAYGLSLGRMMFADAAFAAAYRETIVSIQASHATPRIQLRIAPDIVDPIHWERVFHPQGRGWFPLATSARTPLSRFIPNRSGKSLDTIYERPLRVLAVIASPEDSERDYGLEPIEDADRRIVHDSFTARDIEVTYLETGTPRSPTLNEFRRQLLHGFHIVHFLCHGRATEGGTVLYLEDAHGRVAWAKTQDLVEAFQACDDPPRLCFLAACETGARLEAGALLPLAPALAQRGVAAVVAMTDRVGMNAARQFTQVFYSRFLAHGLADRAANEAREAIRDTWDWSVPVVFLSEPNSALLDVGGHDAPQRALLDELRRNFVGRRDELNTIETLAETPGGPRHIVVEAPAGYGKSALMATLVERNPDWLYHFVRAEERHHTATALLESLCTQLSRRVGTPRSFGGLAQSVLETEFVRLRKAALARLHQPKRLVFVIDGLDESASSPDESVIRPDFYRDDSGSICYVLATRTGTVNIERDLAVPRYEPIVLGGLGADDVKELFRLLERPDLAAHDALAQDVVQQTAGEPFYLRFLAEDLAKRQGPIQIPKGLPRDSRIYISRQVQGLDGEKLLELVPPALRGDPLRAAAAASAILRVLAVAQDWMTRTELAAVLAGGVHVDPLLTHALIPSVRRYFVTHRDPGGSERSERYIIMPLRLREGICGAFDEVQLREAEMWLLEYCRQWKTNSSRYALHWLTYHLDSLGQYEELLRLLDWPFLKTKASILTGLHDTIPDIRRALHAAIRKGESGTIIWLLLLMARVRRSVEIRANVGGIALDAAKGLFDSAMSSARAIGNSETRFGQLLIVGEAALQQNDLEKAHEALDEAFALDIRASHFPEGQANDLLQLLVLRHRDLRRALRLARKIDVDTDRFLSTACLRAMEDDQEYALTLADQITGYYAWSTRQQGAATYAKRDLTFARRLILPTFQQALASGALETVLELLPVTRQVDSTAATDALEEVLTRAHEQLLLDPDRRESAEVINRATVELSVTDVQRAWQLALTVCPDIVDSRYTRATTISAILQQAIEQGDTIDLPPLLAQLPTPFHERYQGFLDVDQYWGRAAVQLAMANRWDESNQCLQLASAPLARATALVWLAILDEQRDVGEVATALSAAQPTDHGFDVTQRAVLRWYTSHPQRAQTAIALVGNADMQFALRGVLWQANRTSAELTSEYIDAAKRLDQTTTAAAGFLAVAESLAADETTRAGELVDEALTAARSMSDSFERREALQHVGTLSMRLRKPEVAVEAVTALAASIENRDNAHGRREGLTDLAVFVLQHRIPIDRTLLDAMVYAISSHYTRSRVAATCGGEAYVNEQALRQRLATSDVYTALLMQAEDKGSLDGVRRISDRVIEPASRALALAAVAGLEPDRSTKLSLLEDAWGLVVTGDSDDEGLEKQRYLLTLQLSEIDAEEALARSDALTPWWRHLLCMTIAAKSSDVQRALEILERGRAAAEMITRASSRFRALANVAHGAARFRPDFADSCRRTALGALDEMEPEDRVVCHLSILASGDKWPAPYGDSVWKRLQADLDEVPWTEPDKEKVLAAAAEIEDRHIAVTAWMHIGLALAHPKVNSYWRHDGEIAQAALALARLNVEPLARQLLRLVTDSLRTKNYYDFDAEAYVAAAERALHDSAAETRLRVLFEKMKEELVAPERSQIMVLVALTALAQEYDGIISQEWSRSALLDLATALVDLSYRSQAIAALATSAMRARDFEQAANLVMRIPLARSQAQAADELMSEFIASDADLSNVAFWLTIASSAERTVEGLLSCAAAWIVLHLRDRTPRESTDAAVADILSKFDYVQT